MSPNSSLNLVLEIDNKTVTQEQLHFSLVDFHNEQIKH